MARGCRGEERRNLDARKKGSRKEIILFILAFYVCIAVIPYAFPEKHAEITPEYLEEWTSGENVDEAGLVTDGEKSLRLRVALIRAAEERVWIENYMMKPDETGMQIAAALIEAADRGVDVRIIVDGTIGLFNLGNRDMAYALGSHKNIRLALYNRLNLLKPWAVNDCFHEKFMLVDDEWLLVGGRNITDEFLKREDNPQYSYDLDVLVHRRSAGKSAADLAAARYQNNLASGRMSMPFEQIPFWKKSGEEKARAELKTLAETQNTMEHPDFTEGLIPVRRTMLIGSGLEAGTKSPVVLRAVLDSLASAEERAVLISPYFTCDEEMSGALRELDGNGVPLMIVTNSAARGNNLAAISETLIGGAIERRMESPVFGVQQMYSLHTKALMVDRDISAIGSFNFDMRSAYIDTEIMLWLEGEEFQRSMQSYLDEMIGKSAPMNAAAEAHGTDLPERIPVPAFKMIKLCILAPFTWLFRFLV